MHTPYIHPQAGSPIATLVLSHRKSGQGWPVLALAASLSTFRIIDIRSASQSWHPQDMDITELTRGALVEEPIAAAAAAAPPSGLFLYVPSGILRGRGPVHYLKIRLSPFEPMRLSRAVKDSQNPHLCA